MPASRIHRAPCDVRCVDPVLTIAAGMSFRSPFLSPMDKRDEADAAKKYGWPVCAASLCDA